MRFHELCKCHCRAGMLKTLVTVVLRNAVRGRPLSDLPGDISLLHRLLIFVVAAVMCQLTTCLLSTCELPVSRQDRCGNGIQVSYHSRDFAGVIEWIGSHLVDLHSARRLHCAVLPVLRIRPDFRLLCPGMTWVLALVAISELRTAAGTTVALSARCGKRSDRPCFCLDLLHQGQKGAPSQSLVTRSRTGIRQQALPLQRVCSASFQAAETLSLCHASPGAQTEGCCH